MCAQAIWKWDSKSYGETVSGKKCDLCLNLFFMQISVSNKFTQMFFFIYSASLTKTDCALEFIVLVMHFKHKVWLAWNIMQLCMEFWYFDVFL